MHSISNASVLIRTREYEIGFPATFSHFPVDMSSEDLDFFVRYATDAMESPREIHEMDGKKLRKSVVFDRGFLVLGISGFLKDIVSDGANECNGYGDLYNRPCYGFIGCVWNMKKEDASMALPDAFPELETFQAILKEHISPNWFRKKHERWADPHPMKYETEVFLGEKGVLDATFTEELNMGKTDEVKVFPIGMGKAQIEQALYCAVKERKDVSVCTDLGEEYEKYSFSNITNASCEAAAMKKKRRKKSTTSYRNSAVSIDDGQSIPMSGSDKDVSDLRGSKTPLDSFSQNPELKKQCEISLTVYAQDFSKVYKVFNRKGWQCKQCQEIRNSLIPYKGKKIGERYTFFEKISEVGRFVDEAKKELGDQLVEIEIIY